MSGPLPSRRWRRRGGAAAGRCAALAAAALPSLLPAAAAPEPQLTPGEVLVRWSPAAARPLGPGPAAQLDSLHEALGLRSQTPLLPLPLAAGRRSSPAPAEAALARWSVLRFDGGRSAAELAERYGRVSAGAPAIRARPRGC